MRVLYVLAHYPQGSESYVEAELAYFSRRGVQLEVWSPQSGYGDTSRVPVRRTALVDTLRNFVPDVVHVHHMTTAGYYLDELLREAPSGRVTVRAHSFDWDDSRALVTSGHDAVRRLYAFPHFERRLRERYPNLPQMKKIVPLPVAYDPALYYRSPKERRSVLRLSAGLPTKSLEQFIVVGNRIREARFTLGINLVIGKEAVVIDRLKGINQSLGGRVEIRQNLSRAEAAELMRETWVYMGTADPASHAFGMPISIAEALATGAYVLTRNVGPEVFEYLGEAGGAYPSLEHAEGMIRTAIGLPDEQFEREGDAAVRSAARFRSDVVLERVLEDWDEISLGG